jgi:hypothetical protein
VPPAVHVRFFLRALPRSVQGPSAYWSDQGHAYLQALHVAGVPLCAATTVRGGTDLGDPRGKWHDLAQLFVAPLHAKHYVNIVCGDNGDVHKLYTIGIPNIAITGITPRHPSTAELASLSKFDEVLCPTEDDAAALRQLGVARATLCLPTDETYPTIVKRYAHAQVAAAAS